MAIVQVPVTKASTDEAPFAMEFDTKTLDLTTYNEALKIGLKTLLGRGMSKETLAKYAGDKAKLAAACAEIAKTNHANMLIGKIRVSGGKKTKGQGAVENEALRLAKARVKTGLREKGYKIGSIKPAQITDLAKQVLATKAGETLREQARKNIAEREATPVEMNFEEIGAKIGAEKAAPRKGRAKSPLSAKQAGQTEKRAKKGPKPGKESRASA